MDSPASPRPRRGGPIRLALLLLLAGAAAVMVAPTFSFPDRWGEPYDWRYFQTSEEIARLTVAEYNQVPLWNPYLCGGEVGLANPQSTAFSPNFLLSLAFGTPVGLKLGLFLLLFCALGGSYLFARRLALSRPGALLAALAYGTCGWFAMHLSQGHPNFGGAALYPLLLYCYQRAATEDLRWSLVGGAVFAWLIGLGGTYTAPMGALLLASYGISCAVAERRWRPLFAGAAIGVAAAGFAAARLLPVLEFVLDHPRHVAESDGMNALDVGRAFLAWRQTLAPVEGHVYWWHEYCVHLPYLALALAPLGALWSPGATASSPARRWGRRLGALSLAWTLFALVLPAADQYLARRLLGYRDLYHLLGVAALWLATRSVQRRWAWFTPLLVVAVGIAVGRAWPHGPWWLIRKLPLYADLRVPPRYLILAALPIALWAGMGLDALLAWLPSRRWPGWLSGRRIAIAAVAVVGIEGLAFSTLPYRGVFMAVGERTWSPDDDGEPPPFQQQEGDLRWMLGGVLENRGTLQCDEEAPLQRGELDVSAPREVIDQVRLLDPAAGSVRLARWSPNAITVALDLARPTQVLINQNWNEHWRVDHGVVQSAAGRLAFSAESGPRTVTLRYRPRSFDVGARISFVSLLLALGLAAWPLRRRADRRPPASPPATLAPPP